MSDMAIEVEGLSKRYRIGAAKPRSLTIGQAIGMWLKTPLDNYKKLRKLRRFTDAHEDDVIWALRDVSFNVAHGEVVGVIGKNGAGKSTLLKILSRISEPTSGRALIRGRVSSLLEVGTGFHQELTGRENVYLNGTILGMSKKEITRKFDEIVSFAEIEKFIDTPVKYYSSGMKVRLAFSVAAHLEPDILIVDEVLSVGDAAFQRKSLGKMGAVARQGRTVLFVSHIMETVRSLCKNAILLHNGEKIMEADCGEVIDYYMKMTVESNLAVWTQESANTDGDCLLHEVRAHGTDEISRDVYSDREDIFVSIRYTLQRPLEGMRMKLRLLSEQGVVIVTTSDISGDRTEQRERGEYVSICRIPRGILNQGVYTVVLFAQVPPFKTLLAQKEYIKFAVERTEIRGSTVHDKLRGVLNPNLVDWSVSHLAFERT